MDIMQSYWSGKLLFEFIEWITMRLKHFTVCFYWHIQCRIVFTLIPNISGLMFMQIETDSVFDFELIKASLSQTKWSESIRSHAMNGAYQNITNNLNGIFWVSDNLHISRFFYWNFHNNEKRRLLDVSRSLNGDLLRFWDSNFLVENIKITSI